MSAYDRLKKMTGEKKSSKKGGNFIERATANKGGLHRALHVPEGKKIPKSEIAAAASKGGKIGKEARLAETLAKLRKKK